MAARRVVRLLTRAASRCSDLGVEMCQEAQIDPYRPPSVHRSDVVADSVVAIFAHVGTHPVADGDAAHSGATRTSGQSP